uniref:Phenylalanine--tRNA ligase, mitochondrial n=1 Tax=Macrostomum lignano TaxID=282301 RepID=A0A1I8G0V1_9PLAT
MQLGNLTFQECLLLQSCRLHSKRLPLSRLPVIYGHRLASTDSGSSGGNAAPNRLNNASAKSLFLCGQEFESDDYTNLTDRIIEQVNCGLHRQRGHPLWLLTNRIVGHFNANYTRSRSRPLFTVVDNLSPIVTPEQNFDSLLIPADHPSRRPSDVYYLNRGRLLRGHTSAHQCDLLRQGLDAFLVVGDVYRRDEIDRSHFPVFHQMEGVRIYSQEQLFAGAKDSADSLRMFDRSRNRTDEQQAGHSVETSKLLEHELKSCLEGLARRLFGSSIAYRWVPAYFPFTHPSWELEVRHSQSDGGEADWMEMLGCGIVEQRLLDGCGLPNRTGWAFGLGLERWAMQLFSVPDIRLFWSKDPAFLAQFAQPCQPGADLWQPVQYKPISVYPPCPMDLSFWLPAADASFHSNDFYDLVRSIAGDLVEQVSLIDEFRHPKDGRMSLCYRIVYRSHERTLTSEEARTVHDQIAKSAVTRLAVQIR